MTDALQRSSVALLLLACGSTHSVADAGASNPADEFVSEWRRTVCDSQIENCVAVPVPWEDTDTCVAHHPALDRFDEIAAVPEGALGYDPEAAAACLRAESSICITESSIGRATNPLAVCRLVFFGIPGLGEGERCWRDFDCGAGLICRGVEDALCLSDRRCQPPAVAGERCSGNNDCAASPGGMACVPDAEGVDHCVAPSGEAARLEGEPCGILRPNGNIGVCGSGLVCHFLGECVRPGAVGEPCGGGLGVCVTGSVCEGDVCVAASRTGDGGPCDALCLYQRGLACAEGVCRPSDGSLGAPCDGTGERCSAELVCRGARCATSDMGEPAGSACGLDGDCSSSCCAEGVCVEL